MANLVKTIKLKDGTTAKMKKSEGVYIIKVPSFGSAWIAGGETIKSAKANALKQLRFLLKIKKSRK